MAVSYVIEGSCQQTRMRQLAFAGDGVRLAGQIDYPTTPRPPDRGYPLVFMLHHVGWNSREDYRHYTLTALNIGHAVFRWDKRGTGRSGASGRGSATQDAVNAYETALEQPDVDFRRAVILAQNEGSLMLGSAFGLFARIQRPAGVILAGNMLNKDAIAAIDAPLFIAQGERDWHRWEQFARDAATAHRERLPYGAEYYVANNADRMLMTGEEKPTFHYGAVLKIQDWLKRL
ncbi:MAG: alpha/beta hydrolase family protein [Chloroflexota bacterium]